MCEILPKMRKICFFVTTLKILQLLEDVVLQTLYRGSASGPRRRTPIHQTPCGFCPHPTSFRRLWFDHRARFGCCFTYCVRACVGGPKTFGGEPDRRRPWLTPEKHSTLHICYHIKCHSCQTIWGCVRGPKYFWDYGAPSLGMGRG